MINAVIYSRVSSDSERQDTQRQITELKEYANGTGYNLKPMRKREVNTFKISRNKKQIKIIIQKSSKNNKFVKNLI